MKLCLKKEIENGNKSAKYAPLTFGLLKKPVKPVTHISSPPFEHMGFRNQTINPFKNSKGPYHLKKYWIIPLIKSGTEPKIKKFAQIILNFWELK